MDNDYTAKRICANRCTLQPNRNIVNIYSSIYILTIHMLVAGSHGIPCVRFPDARSVVVLQMRRSSFSYPPLREILPQTPPASPFRQKTSQHEAEQVQTRSRTTGNSSFDNSAGKSKRSCCAKMFRRQKNDANPLKHV